MNRVAGGFSPPAPSRVAQGNLTATLSQNRGESRDTLHIFLKTGKGPSFFLQDAEVLHPATEIVGQWAHLRASSMKANKRRNGMVFLMLRTGEYCGNHLHNQPMTIKLVPQI